jgi:sulfotransferase family protein
MSAPVGAPSLLLIGGLGRSGSTLLELALSGVDEVVGVGELRYIWRQGLREDLLCGCGERFSECTFWQAVGESAFGGWSRVDADEMLELADRADRHRYIPGYVRQWRGVRPRRNATTTYLRKLRRLYEAIAQVSQARLIVDTSKDPPHAFLCEQLGIDFKVLHLVRDCRGVAFSWSRRTRRPEVAAATTYMATYHPLEVAARWWDYNLLYEMLGRRLGNGYRRLRYEDFVQSPNPRLLELLRWAGVGVENHPSVVCGRTVLPRRVHSVGGNPIRFHDGPHEVLIDNAWHTRMRGRDRLTVTLAAAPMLWRYGYPLTAAKYLSARRGETVMP